MKYEPYRLLLEQMCERTMDVRLSEDSRVVIFSDLHMGDGRTQDDFIGNSALFMAALNDYYFEEGYTLILNGDVEELHRYSLHQIREKWGRLYDIFDRFLAEGRFYKIFGNHDSKLLSFPDQPLRYPLYEAVKLVYGGHTILVFHGHQLSFYYQKFNDLMGLVLRYVARPLRLKHYSVAHDKRKKYIIERRLYEFAREKGIAALIGHTHRPLFESMSKVDTLNWEIETLLRKYQKIKREERPEVEEQIQELKREIDRQEAKKGKELSLSRLYSDATIVPCVFNSGCVMGKRGITGIEIDHGKIKLVHWFDKKVKRKYNREDTKNTIRLEGSDFFRTVLKKNDLEYIFNRIRLLS